MSKRFQLHARDYRGIILVKRHVKFEEGESLVRRQRADYVLNEDGDVVAFVLLATQGMPPKPTARKLVDVIPQGCQPYLTLKQVEAVAGVYGPSQTMNAPEGERHELVRRSYVEEDFIERAIHKFQALYPQAATA